MTRTITAFFDSRTEAQRASDRLVSEAGVNPAEISIHDQGSTGSTAAGHKDKGFWASLGDLFVPDDDRYTYEEGIRRGGSVLTVRSEVAEFERVSDILEAEGSVDLDARETEWRSQGWSGTGTQTNLSGSNTAAASSTYDAASGSASYGATNEVTSTSGTTGGLGATAFGTDTSRTASAASAGQTGGADYIPVAEERMRVGKREVEHGRVRVRSYVVETPVEENVSLREERVHLERNAVDRPATAADNLFQERVIEANETAEEAVVSKDARVVEEVRLDKNVTQRDETVRDSVRRTEVEVEDDRATTRGVTGGSLTEEERLRTLRSH